MSSESKNNHDDKGKLYAGATALISVLAVPVTILTGLLLSNKHKNKSSLVRGFCLTFLMLSPTAMK